MMPAGCPPELPSDASERLAAFARQAATLAHDLNNAFTPILGNTSLVRDELAAAEPASLDVAQMLLDLDAALAATTRGVELSKKLVRLALAQLQEAHQE